MKKTAIKPLFFALAGGVVLAGCDGLGKMAKNANTITYEVTPKPLEEHGDSISITLTGKFPGKYFNKKVAVAVTPVLIHNGKETPLTTRNFKGMSSQAEGTVVDFEKGASFNYTEKIAYSPDMQISELHVKAVGSKGTAKKEFGGVKVADGTIITPLMVMLDNKPSLAADRFTKSTTQSASADIHFNVSQSDVRGAELSKEDMKALNDFIKNGIKEGYAFLNLEVSAYASPDGEEKMNAGLAERRASEAANQIVNALKKAKIAIASNPDFAKKSSTPEDWEGFKNMMQKSDLKDKELILRVLTMYPDLAQREKEIKNMAATYTEISDKIMPELRRAQIRLNAEKISRTDAQISALVSTSPDSLSVEEILYAATLVSPMDAKLKIYQSAEKLYPNDWRGINNVGYVYLLQNKLGDAQAQFEKAANIDNKNAVIKNNLGIIAHIKGDKSKAASLFNDASADKNAQYNLGIINIQSGDYVTAVNNMSGFNTFNAALAKLLAGNSEGALSTLEASSEKDSALGYYLKAVIGARSGNQDLMINNMKAAIAKDASLKEKAKQDMEFQKYKTDAAFNGLL
jgi:Flp pilus assembly protein TadD